MLEQTYQDAIVRAVNAPKSGVRLWRQSVAQARPCRCGAMVMVRTGAPVGASDLIGIVSPEGWLLEVEVKGAKTTTTAKQKQRGVFVASRGGVYVLARYVAKDSLEDNVARAVAAIADAIATRRA